VELTDEILGPLAPGASVAGLDGGGTVERLAEARLRRRAIHPALRWTLASAFPGGFWRTSVSRREPVAITVFPRPVWPGSLQQPSAVLDDPGHGFATTPRRDDNEFLGIREFAPGDPLKHVHWRATARAQRLVVREFDQELPAGYALFFFSFQPPGPKRMDDAFESALELLTGLLLGCRAQRLPLTLAADFTDWRTVRLAGGDVGDALRLMAGARWSPSSDVAPLLEKLAEVPDRCRVFIVSDTPLRHWEALVPASRCEVTCLSVAEMRRHRPVGELGLHR
jgi:uncharacterized protein (DUF58 family)